MEVSRTNITPMLVLKGGKSTAGPSQKYVGKVEP